MVDPASKTPAPITDTSTKARRSPGVSETFHVVGMTHIDLAWLYDSAHYRECQEAVAARMLDLLDHDPGFTYLIEQILHYRWLNETRPDLIGRIREYVAEGRVEIGGGMASSLDTNGPNGEGYVRSHLLGSAWTKEHLGGTAKVGELMDTFGISAQSPQIHRQFGMNYLLANRLGGAVESSVFRARGLDGSTLLVAGPDVHSPGLIAGQAHFRMVNSNIEVYDGLFDRAAEAVAEGPHLVLPYDECEHVPWGRSRYHIDRLNGKGKGCWKYSTLLDFFRDLEAAGQEHPVIGCDLNPVLTGCYGLRPFVRLRNRQIETALIEAEKWAVLLGSSGFRETVNECWWNLSYIHSHDIYTGSFPHERVLPEVTCYLDDTERRTAALLQDSFGAPVEQIQERGNTVSVTVYNGLPWERTDLVVCPLPEGWNGVASATCQGKDVPFEERDGRVRVLAEVAPVGAANLTLHRRTDSAPPEVGPTGVGQAAITALENEYLKVECSAQKGIERITLVESGRVVAENCGGLITAQQDLGTYQRESPANGEVHAHAGSMQMSGVIESAAGQSVRLSGLFPDLKWAGPGNKLEWELELEVLKGKPRLDVSVHLNWTGEASRVRLQLPTMVDSATALCEIPFGVVKRSAYGVRDTARGQWPAHRFVAVEDGDKGVALINTGAMGVELAGGTIQTTLFRAPATDWIRLRRDESSSQHGEHAFRFAVVPYAGSLGDSPVVQVAQEVNNPLLCRLGESRVDGSLMSLSPSTCVLSAVKAPEDGTDDEAIVRFYETAGRACRAILEVRGMKQLWCSNLPEERLDETTVTGGRAELAVKPFEIVTVRLKR
jgi:alpha-mannosidase